MDFGSQDCFFLALQTVWLIFMFRVYIIETCINTIETGTKELFPLCTTFPSTLKGPAGAKHQSCMAVQALRYLVRSFRVPI